MEARRWCTTNLKSARRLRCSLQSIDGSTGTVHCEVVSRLEIEPKLWSRTQSLGQKPGGFRCDTTLASHELVYALNRHSNVLGKGHLSLTKGLEILLPKNLARMGRDTVGGLHYYPLW